MSEWTTPRLEPRDPPYPNWMKMQMEIDAAVRVWIAGLEKCWLAGGHR